MPEPLINLLAAVWTDTLVLAADLTEDEWNRSTDCPGWSVKDHVAHMIGTEHMLEGEQPPPADIGDAAHVRNDIGTFNEQWVAVYRDRPGKEALDDFRVITDRRLATLRALPAEEWEKEGFTPEGPGPYRQFMEIRVFDCWFHDQDMREALNRQGFLEGPAADLSLGRIPPKGLPYVVGRRPARRKGRVWCSTSRARRRSSPRSRSRAAPRCSTHLPPIRRPRSPWTGVRSAGSRVGAGTATGPVSPEPCKSAAMSNSVTVCSTTWRSRSRWLVSNGVRSTRGSVR